MGAKVGVGKGVKGYSEMGQVRGPVSVATEVGVVEVVVTGVNVENEELELAVVAVVPVEVLVGLPALLGTPENENEDVELVSDWTATTCTTASSQALNVGPITTLDSTDGCRTKQHGRYEGPVITTPRLRDPREVGKESRLAISKNNNDSPNSLPSLS